MANDGAREIAIEKASADRFEPAVVLPSQFFRGDAGGASLQPEKRLMLAVLEEAVTTFHKHAAAQTGVGRRLFADAETWIAADDTEWPFSFLNICQTLGLELAYVRSGLRRWRERLRATSDHHGIVIRSPFRHITGSRTRATELRCSA